MPKYDRMYTYEFTFSFTVPVKIFAQNKKEAEEKAAQFTPKFPSWEVDKLNQLMQVISYRKLEE